MAITVRSCRRANGAQPGRRGCDIPLCAVKKPFSYEKSTVITFIGIRWHATLPLFPTHIRIQVLFYPWCHSCDLIEIKAWVSVRFRNTRVWNIDEKQIIPKRGFTSDIRWTTIIYWHESCSLPEWVGKRPLFYLLRDQDALCTQPYLIEFSTGFRNGCILYRRYKRCSLYSIANMT